MNSKAGDYMEVIGRLRLEQAVEVDAGCQSRAIIETGSTKKWRDNSTALG
jgi:hypothetical protein